MDEATLTFKQDGTCEIQGAEGKPVERDLAWHKERLFVVEQDNKWLRQAHQYTLSLVMQQTLQRMGQRFSVNLLRHLGVGNSQT